MVLWTARDVARLLEEAEKIEEPFPVRTDTGRLPYSLTFKGSIQVLTDHRVVSLGYGRFSSRPTKVQWASPRQTCRTRWSDGILTLLGSGGSGHEEHRCFVARTPSLGTKSFAAAVGGGTMGRD